MPELEPKEGEPNAEPTPDPNLEAVKSIAEEFAATLKADREAQAAVPAPAPVVAAPTGPTPQEIAQELLEKKTKVSQEADELAAAGEFSKAAEHLLNFQAEVQQATQGDPTESPAYKAMLVSAERNAKRDNADMFEKYDKDIQAEIAAMVPGDRINPDSWDEAVRRVKAQHVDEIINDRIAAASEEAKEKQKTEAAKPVGRFTVPVAPGSQGNRPDPEVVELDEQQIAAASLLNYTPEEYADVILAADTYVIRKGMSSGMHELCDKKTPEPGGF